MSWVFLTIGWIAWIATVTSLVLSYDRRKREASGGS